MKGGFVQSVCFFQVVGYGVFNAYCGFKIAYLLLLDVYKIKVLTVQILEGCNANFKRFR